MASTQNASGFAFTCNPICFTDTDTEGSKKTFAVRIGGKTVYTGQYFPPATIDVSEIADIFIPAFPAQEKWEDLDFSYLVEKESEMSARTLSAVSSGGDELIKPVIAFKGGLSVQNLRYLNTRGTDIFKARLLNTGANYFLTTRTHSWLLTIKETELAPLLFIVEQEMRFEVTAYGTDIKYSKTFTAGVLAFDIEELRRKIWREHQILASVIDISDDGTFSCRIIIEEAEPSKERHRLKFRNSFGAFEIIELTGECTVLSESEGDSDDTQKEFDTISRTFRTKPSPASRTTIFTIGSGPKNTDEFLFMGDMLQSEETYLETDGAWERVAVSAEEFSYKQRQRAPESIKLRIEMIDADIQHTPPITDSTELERGRIFSDEHTDTFN